MTFIKQLKDSFFFQITDRKKIKLCSINKIYIIIKFNRPFFRNYKCFVFKLKKDYPNLTNKVNKPFLIKKPGFLIRFTQHIKNRGTNGISNLN